MSNVRYSITDIELEIKAKNWFKIFSHFFFFGGGGEAQVCMYGIVTTIKISET